MNIPEDIAGLKALVIQLIAENTELKKIIQVQAARIKELEMQLNANSGNSSKPPSSDGLKKKPALVKSINGIKGGQKGHTGQTLKQISNPDQTIILPLTTCSCCGEDLSKIQSESSETRQVFNLPEPRLLSIEYQNRKAICPHCKKMQYSNFPANVNAPVQYGDGVKAFVVLLSVGYKIPFKKIRLLFADLFHYPINESTITTASEICYQKLEETEKNIIERIKNSFLAHLDETGMRIQGQLRWLHTVSTTMLTYLWVHIHRGTKALNSSKSIIRQLKNWILHDCWLSYFQYRNVKHALCGAHILRELQALIEDKSKWAKEFSELLLEIYHFRKLNPTQSKPEWSIRYDELCCIAHQEEPPPKNSGKQGKEIF